MRLNCTRRTIERRHSLACMKKNFCLFSISSQRACAVQITNKYTQHTQTASFYSHMKMPRSVIIIAVIVIPPSLTNRDRVAATATSTTLLV